MINQKRAGQNYRIKDNILKSTNNIAIIGIGLIGGSIALCLKKKYGSKITIFGFCNIPKRTVMAKKAQIIDEILDLENPIPENIGLVIISSPISSVPSIFKNLSEVVSHHILVIDTASTKEYICQKAATVLSSNISFIGTHPMAGKETNGFENADPFIFNNKPWIICSGEKTRVKDLLFVKHLIRVLGAKPVVMTAKTHDKTCSFASHLHLCIASVLIKTASKQNKWPLISKIASSGFRDTTRLALHNPEMIKDIIITNKENTVDSLLKVKREIDSFVKILKQNKEAELLNYFSEAKKIRDFLKDNDYKS